MIILLIFIFFSLLSDTQIPVYNCSSVRKSVTTNSLTKHLLKYFESHPFHDILWRPSVYVTSSKFLFTLLTIIKQVIPGILINAAVKGAGKTPSV